MDKAIKILRSLLSGWSIATAIAVAIYWSQAESPSIAIAIVIGVIGIMITIHESLKPTIDDWIESSARGRKLTTCEQAAQSAKRNLPYNDPGVLWGKCRIRSEDATWHFCVVGSVGSGKTLTIRMLLQDQLPLLKKGSDRRALIYDAKQDMVPIVESMKLSCPVLILNPFDARGVAWHMASDVQTPTAARQLAVTLVPEEKESQPFFTNAVRELLTAVVNALILRQPGKWTFRQVLLIMKSKERLKALLGSDPRFADTVNIFLNCGATTLGSIMATTITKLGPFEPIAEAWDNAERKMSIAKWLKSVSILILGNDERIRSSLDTMNQLIVTVISQQSLTMSESSTRMTWCIFDEFREAGKITGLSNMIVRGRSKGVCVVLGFQDIQGVQEVYEERVGNELVGQCGNKMLLRIESPETAEWASKSIGDKEQVERQHSESKSGQGGSHSTSYQKHQRAVVLPSEFMELPATNRTHGLTGYCISRSLGTYQVHYTPTELNEGLGHIDEKIASFSPAPAAWQYLKPWTDADSKSLGMQNASPASDSEENDLDGFERMI